MKPFLVIFFLIETIFTLNTQNNPDAILGKWRTVQDNLEVEVYRKDENFGAKILWFNDTDNKSKPMQSRVDDKNPNESLRSRKLIGMEVLRDLRYNPDDDEWQDGKVYVAKNGKEWDSVAWLTQDSLLKVKGYWLFKFLGQTLTFKRVN